MKEVLIHGIYANKVAYCVCGCSFKYDEEDVVKDLSNAGSSVGAPTLRYVICPECGARCYVPTVVTIPGYTPPQPSVPQTPVQPYYWPYDYWWTKPMCGDSTNGTITGGDPNVKITMQGAKNE